MGPMGLMGPMRMMFSGARENRPTANGKLPTANPLTILANSSFRISVDIPVAWNMTPFNREVKIFSGSAHPELAKRIAQSMGAPLGDATVTSFPDGEIGRG